MTRQFLVTSERSQDGVVYGYDQSSGLLCQLEIKQCLASNVIALVLRQAPLCIDELLAWCRLHKYTVVELQQKITFDMLWDKYNDKARSSKKKSQKLWEKLDEANQVKAYYHYDAYNRNRGNADKKYCETYLRDELWNN